MLDLIRPSLLNSEVLLTGPQLLLRDLVNLECGDVVSFEYPANRALTMTLNGKEKFNGEMVASGRRAAFRVGQQLQGGL